MSGANLSRALNLHLHRSVSGSSQVSFNLSLSAQSEPKILRLVQLSHVFNDIILNSIVTKLFTHKTETRKNIVKNV